MIRMIVVVLALLLGGCATKPPASQQSEFKLRAVTDQAWKDPSDNSRPSCFLGTDEAGKAIIGPCPKSVRPLPRGLTR